MKGREPETDGPNVWRRLALAVVAALLLVLSWGALSGAVSQWPSAGSPGQRVETVIQAAAGVLSLLVPLTPFALRPWARPIRLAWGISAAAAAGLSALVWGPPMPLMALGFTGAAGLLAWGLVRGLDAAAGRGSA